MFFKKGFNFSVNPAFHKKNIDKVVLLALQYKMSLHSVGCVSYYICIIESPNALKGLSHDIIRIIFLHQ
jgi:hypothetical protein